MWWSNRRSKYKRRNKGSAPLIPVRKNSSAPPTPGCNNKALPVRSNNMSQAASSPGHKEMMEIIDHTIKGNMDLVNEGTKSNKAIAVAALFATAAIHGGDVGMLRPGTPLGDEMQSMLGMGSGGTDKGRRDSKLFDANDDEEDVHDYYYTDGDDNDKPLALRSRLDDNEDDDDDGDMENVETHAAQNFPAIEIMEILEGVINGNKDLFLELEKGNASAAAAAAESNTAMATVVAQSNVDVGMACIVVTSAMYGVDISSMLHPDTPLCNNMNRILGMETGCRDEEDFDTEMKGTSPSLHPSLILDDENDKENTVTPQKPSARKLDRPMASSSNVQVSRSASFHPPASELRTSMAAAKPACNDNAAVVNHPDATVAPPTALQVIENIVQKTINSNLELAVSNKNCLADLAECNGKISDSNKAVGMAGIMAVAALGGGNIDTLAPRGTPLRDQIALHFGAM